MGIVFFPVGKPLFLLTCCGCFVGLITSKFLSQVVPMITLSNTTCGGLENGANTKRGHSSLGDSSDLQAVRRALLTCSGVFSI